MKISAVVVTYNRLNLLKRVVEHLLAEPLVDEVVVVNNGSTDGTYDWLATASGDRLHVVVQDNVGGSGGFYTGISVAYERGADYVWCMDDDVYPSEGCLAELLRVAGEDGVGIACPSRRMVDDYSLFVNECRGLNLWNPFASLHSGNLKRKYPESNTDIMGMVFEGPLIKREVIERVGLPNRDLFIFYDDTDYSYRAVLAGFRVVYVCDAVLLKERFFNTDTWADKQQKKKWKRLYQLRNSAYFNHTYGKNAGVKYLRALPTLLGYVLPTCWLAMTSSGFCASDVRALFQAYAMGMRGRLGKIDY